MATDEAYISGLPAVPVMVDSKTPRRARIPVKKVTPPKTNGHLPDEDKDKTPPLDPSGPVKLEKVVHRNVNRLAEARKVMNQIHEFQRIEAEDGILPDIAAIEAREKAKEEQERIERKRMRAEEAVESNKRRKIGGEVGAKEASLAMKKATAGMLAHAGFEGKVSRSWPLL